MDPILEKFKAKFLEEAFQLLDQLENNLLELEKDYQNKELINAAFRAMHTLKGTSSMYGFENISEFTHLLESLYQGVRDNNIALCKEIIEVSFKSVDHVRKMLNDENLDDEQNKSTHVQLTKEISNLLANPQLEVIQKVNSVDNNSKNTGHATMHTYQILLRTDEKLYFRGINLVNIFHDLSQRGEFVIEHLKYLSNESSDWWNIIYVTDADEEAIRDTLMFIDDNCLISYLSPDNILEHPDLLSKEKKEKSIIDLIGNPQKRNTVENNSAKAESHKKEDNQSFNQRIAVESEKLDHLMYLVSELITIDSHLNMAIDSKEFELIKNCTEKLDNLSKQFRNNALEIRLVPLADIILRFQRLIRDLSKQLNKKVALVTHGMETELDKSTIDNLYEPLMHIIRNDIDHGIELPEIRRKKGKPEEGKITITASHSGNNVVIKIDDDGCGIDKEKIRRKAVEKGIWPENFQPTEKEIFDLIFLPGFSTAQNLTEISGRGVGMDIVLRKIKEMRGNIIVESQSEVGTSFIIYLQQSIAIIDTLLFSVGDQYFIIPISDIEICQQYNWADLKERKKTSTIPFHNHLIPFIDLREKFDISEEYPEKLKIIVVNHSEGQLAILADKIIGEHQAVLKPLGKVLKDQKYITSASQLGDSNIAFMLDTLQLFQSIVMKKI
jgi:two-component system chemotaxis sensor kinase CheA